MSNLAEFWTKTVIETVEVALRLEASRQRCFALAIAQGRVSELAGADLYEGCEAPHDDPSRARRREGHPEEGVDPWP